jgi:hypothetical protein
MRASRRRRRRSQGALYLLAPALGTQASQAGPQQHSCAVLCCHTVLTVLIDDPPADRGFAAAAASGLALQPVTPAVHGRGMLLKHLRCLSLGKRVSNHGRGQKPTPLQHIGRPLRTL